MSTWKSVERNLATRLGGQRLSNHSLGCKTPDVETSAWSIEVKHRKALPAWLTGALDQARANATPGKLPLVVWHEKGRRHDNDLVVLRLRDFEEWFGEVDVEGEGEEGAT